MKVTILMPILDRADFHRNIERQINSQTVQPHEVIFVEDSRSLLKHGDQITPACGSRYVIAPEDHISYTEKKIRGLQAATGDLIVIMSSDDYYGPEYIERWLRVMEKTDSPIARFRSHWVYNIVDRRYGFVANVSGGHSVYLREWALQKYDSRENTLNYMQMPRTNRLLGQFAIIRHTPAGIAREDDFRRT